MVSNRWKMRITEKNEGFKMTEKTKKNPAELRKIEIGGLLANFGK